VKRIPVRLARRSYEIVVGAGVLDVLASVVAGRRRVAVVSQEAIARRYAAGALDAARAGGAAAELFLMGDGEVAKTLATVEDLSRRLSSWGMLRNDAIVALGGGVVGDTAGFTASCYYRGVDVVQVPTSLLAQVDASIGGKTGVNLPEGKNLVGAFHQPIAVLADTGTLASLPDREYRSGLGEVAKYALMDGVVEDGTGLVDLLRRNTDDVLARDPEVLAELVARCAAVKAAVVMGDEEERTGLRATLNYGHTLAHALETAGSYDLLHGEAVAIGLMFAAQLAAELERIDDDDLDRHQALLTALGLPGRVPDGPGAAEVLALMRRDKKAHGGLTFVLRGPNGLELVDDPPADAVEHALRVVGVQG